MGSATRSLRSCQHRSPCHYGARMSSPRAVVLEKESDMVILLELLLVDRKFVKAVSSSADPFLVLQPFIPLYWTMYFHWSRNLNTRTSTSSSETKSVLSFMCHADMQDYHLMRKRKRGILYCIYLRVCMEVSILAANIIPRIHLYHKKAQAGLCLFVA